MGFLVARCVVQVAYADRDEAHRIWKNRAFKFMRSEEAGRGPSTFEARGGKAINGFDWEFSACEEDLPDAHYFLWNWTSDMREFLNRKNAPFSESQHMYITIGERVVVPEVLNTKEVIKGRIFVHSDVVFLDGEGTKVFKALGPFTVAWVKSKLGFEKKLRRKRL